MLIDLLKEKNAALVEENKLLLATLRDARDMAVGWMLTADRLTAEQAVENVKRFDALLNAK